MKKSLWMVTAFITPVVMYGATYTWDGSGNGVFRPVAAQHGSGEVATL